MKTLLTTLVLVAFGASAAFAACGKTETDKGLLQSMNAESKQITIQTADGKSVTRTLTPTSKMTGKDGAVATGDALKGKTVSVVSEHGKVQTVAEAS